MNITIICQELSIRSEIDLDNIEREEPTFKDLLFDLGRRYNNFQNFILSNQIEIYYISSNSQRISINQDSAISNFTREDNFVFYIKKRNENVVSQPQNRPQPNLQQSTNQSRNNNTATKVILSIIVIIIIIIAIASYVSNRSSNYSDKTFNNNEYYEDNTENNNEEENITRENFDTFYDKFCDDPSFQLTRIKFPLKGNSLSYGSYPDDSDPTPREWTRSDWGRKLPKYTETDYEQAGSIFEIEKKERKVRMKEYFPSSEGAFTVEFSLISGEWFLTYAKSE